MTSFICPPDALRVAARRSGWRWGFRVLRPTTVYRRPARDAWREAIGARRIAEACPLPLRVPLRLRGRKDYPRVLGCLFKRLVEGRGREGFSCALGSLGEKATARPQRPRRVSPSTTSMTAAVVPLTSIMPVGRVGKMNVRAVGSSWSCRTSIKKVPEAFLLTR